LELDKIIAITISAATFIMVLKNYKFNYQKNSYSTISVKGKKVKTVTMRSLFRKLDFDSDKNYVNSVDDNDIFFDMSNGGFAAKFVNGFPIKNQRHESFDWYLEFKNIGDFPSTNIKIKYQIHIEKLLNHYKFDEDEMINNHSFELIHHDTISKEFVIPYMAADEEKKLFICTLSGEFPKALLYVKELRSKELSFIKNLTLIDSYEHPNLGDINSLDTRNLLELSGNNPSVNDVDYSHQMEIEIADIENVNNSRKPNIKIDEHHNPDHG